LLKSTRIDPRKRLEIHRDIDRYSMVRAVPPDTQPDRCELGIPDVDSGSVAPASRLDVVSRDGVDNDGFQALDEAPHRQTPAPEVYERVRDELPRAVVGHLAAAIDLDDGNLVRIQYMARICV
jgi:hypothetical protein